MYLWALFVRCECAELHVQLACQLGAPVVPKHHSSSAQRTSTRKQSVRAVCTNSCPYMFNEV